MADPASSPGATPNRRDLRRDRSRRRVTRVLIALVVCLVLTGGVVLATNLLQGDDTPSAARTLDVPPAADPSTTTTAAAHARQCRTLSSDDPLRLWVGGDSLAGSLGPALGEIAGATGVVQPYFDSRVSSGLASPGFFDWPDHATTEMARLDPEVVVFIIGTNDWTEVSTADWKADYEATVDSMMKTLIGPGRTVYWLGAPTLKQEAMDKAVVEVNAAAQEVAKRHKEVHYVDTYKLFSDRDGTFSFDLPDESGETVTMRAGDGVHLTTDGADYLARNVYKLVDAQCGVTEQKVDGQTKQTIETEGSTQVARGSSSSSGSSSGSGTVQTTPPATAAPTTSPPVVSEPPPSSTEAPTTTTVAPTSTTTGGGPTAQAPSSG
jgi:hypothetical protein